MMKEFAEKMKDNLDKSKTDKKVKIKYMAHDEIAGSIDATVGRPNFKAT